jgi:hypothetical protein
MILTSEEFDAALESELDRLLIERIANYGESDEFYERLDKAVQKEMDKIYPFIYVKSSGDTLQLDLSLPDFEAVRYVDIEQAIDNNIAYCDAETLQFILSRLDLMASKVREAVLHNAALSGARKHS